MGQPSRHSGFKLAVRMLAGCACAAMAAAPSAWAQAPTQPRTSDEASQQTLGGAITSPLRDMNMVRDEVPHTLTKAQEAPYVNPEDASCAQLSEMIAPLDSALGPDVGDGAEKPKAGAANMVYGAMADVARDVIPFRGVVRRITGASKQDQKVRDAREAGQLRRAYLKGFASAKGCYGPVDPDAVTIAADTQATDVGAVAVAELAPLPAADPAPTLGSAPAPSEARPIPVATAAPTATPQPVYNLPASWQAALEPAT